MLNETNIRCFLVLAETLNFTETARRVYLTQQAVSKNISNLEATIGFPLIDRTKHYLVLTEEGKHCAELFRELGRMYTEKINELQTMTARNSSVVRVGYQDFIELGSAFFGVNNTMRERHPDLQLIVTRDSPGTLISLFLGGKLDLIIIYGRYFSNSQGYCKHELLEVPVVIMVSPQNPNVSEDAVYNDFKNEPYIVNIFENENKNDFEKRVKIETEACGLTPSKIIMAPNRDSAYSSAELNNGILRGSEISQTYEGSRLLKYRTDAVESLSCVWRKNEPNKMVMRYVEQLKKAYGN